jgi:hypothetical protein
VPTTSMVYPSRMEASSNRPSQRGARPTKASGVVQEAASLIYQASLFSAAMVSHSDFSPATVFKRAATLISKAFSNLLGLKGRYLCLDGCYWTREHNP